jgi:hypothetical protein
MRALLMTVVVLLTLFPAICPGDDSAICLTMRLANKPVEPRGGFVDCADNDSSPTFGPRWYVEPASGYTAGVDFEHGRFCEVQLLWLPYPNGQYPGFKRCSVDVLRKFPTPSVGERLVFLYRNEIVGRGRIDSVVEDFTVDGDQVQSFQCSATDGRAAAVRMTAGASDPLATTKRVQYVPRLNDSLILAAMRRNLGRRHIARGLDGAFDSLRITSKIAAPSSPTRLNWLVTAECPIGPSDLELAEMVRRGSHWSLDSATGKYLEAEGLSPQQAKELRDSCEAMKYVVNAIVFDDMTPSVDFLVACPTVNALWPQEAIAYCQRCGFSFVTESGDKSEPGYSDQVLSVGADSLAFSGYTGEYEHYDRFVDWVDLEGDGTGEVILAWHGYEDSGFQMYKRVDGEWRPQ